MSNTKRLGPQDPLSWIKDTRGQISKYASLRTSTPQRSRSSRILGEEESSPDIRVVIKGNEGERIVSVEITVDNKGTTKIEVKKKVDQKNGREIKSYVREF